MKTSQYFKQFCYGFSDYTKLFAWRRTKIELKLTNACVCNTYYWSVCITALFSSMEELDDHQGLYMIIFPDFLKIYSRYPPAFPDTPKMKVDSSIPLIREGWIKATPSGEPSSVTGRAFLCRKSAQTWFWFSRFTSVCLFYHFSEWQYYSLL